MFIIKLLRRLRGFVRFSLRGGFPERVISLAARKGIAIRDVHKTENGICAYIAASDYKRLHRHARNCGCKMRVERKYGLPFFLHRNRKRKGLFAGALAALLFLSLMSHSVWVIEINGNTSLSDGEILYTLRQNGLYAGAPKRNINLISTNNPKHRFNNSFCYAIVLISFRLVNEDVNIKYIIISIISFNTNLKWLMLFFCNCASKLL